MSTNARRFSLVVWLTLEYALTIFIVGLNGWIFSNKDATGLVL